MPTITPIAVRLSRVLRLALLASLALTATLMVMPSSGMASTAARSGDEQLLNHVVFVGASATDGWNVECRARDEDLTVTRPVKLHDVFAASMKSSGATISSYSDFMFYTRPTIIGPRQIDAAMKDEPTLLVGIDYLFWYSYGNFGPDGKFLRQDADRLELLELGLAQLDRLDCPIIIGDIPDMSAAVGLMLGASQMPEQETLKQINERIHEWANEKPRVTVFPLAKLCAAMAKREAFSIGEHNWTEAMAGETIQADQLHPTVLGLIALNQQLIQTLASVHGIAMDGVFVNEAAAMRSAVEKALLDAARARQKPTD